LRDEVAIAARDYARALPAKTRALAKAIARTRIHHDKEALAVARSLAHRLRGTAGCYGFAELGVFAAVIEDSLWNAFSATGAEAERRWAVIDRALAQLDAIVLRQTG
jgi:HPt (histidine-containing phosphotransfer) domain-containing protein